MSKARDRFKERMSAVVGNRLAGFEVRNADGDRAVVRIYEEIGYWGVSAEDFARALSGITANEIEVQINSPGGDVFDGIAIYNSLRTHPAKVTTRVDGIAASAASVIAQAGDHRVMVQAGQMMIHEAWGVAYGPADEVRDFADLLDQQNDIIAGIYAQRSGGDQDELRQLMAATTWLTDQGAVDLGLADEVFVPAAQAKSTIQIDGKKLPAAVADRMPVAAYDPTEHLGRDWVREMFGSTALAD